MELDQISMPECFHTIKGSGFHLKHEITVRDNQSSEENRIQLNCLYPPMIYVDGFQLGIEKSFPNNVQYELSHSANIESALNPSIKSQTLVLNAAVVKEAVFTIPIHVRYGEAKYRNLNSNFQVESINLVILKEGQVESTITCLPSEIELTVPVGQLNHLAFVAPITSIIAFLSSLVIVFLTLMNRKRSDFKAKRK